MSVDIATLGIKVDSSQAATGARNLDRMAASGKRAETAFEGMQRQINATLGPLRMIQGLILGTAAALGIQRIIEYADAWKLVEGRLKLVTNSQRELVSVQNQVFQIAQRTRSAYLSTAELYARTARASDQLGASQQELLRFTELTAKAVITSGASAQEASAGIIQLGQALASGTLRGDELRSVLENLNGLAIEIAAGMGTTVGQLRRLAEEGKLTSEAIFRAVLSRADQIEERFGTVPVTVGQALTVLDNAWGNFIKNADSSLGVTTALAGAVILLSDNLDVLAGLAAGVATVAILKVATAIDVAAIATRAWTAALAVNPFTLIAVAISTVIGLMVAYRDHVEEIGGVSVRVGNVMNAIWVTIRESVSGTVMYVVRLIEALSKLAKLDFSGGLESFRKAGKELQDSGNAMIAAWTNLGPAAEKALGSLSEAAKEALPVVSDMTKQQRSLIESLGDEVNHLIALSAAYAGHGQSIEAVELSYEALQKARAADIAQGSELHDQVRGLTASIRDLNKEIDSQRRIVDMRDDLALAQRELELVGATAQERAVGLAVLRTELDLKRRNIDLTSSLAQEELQLARQIASVRSQAQEMLKALDDVIATPAKGVRKKYQRKLRREFVNIFLSAERPA
ncbi:tape measure protein [Oceanibaculum indicum]|uniref:Putative tail length tape measure protein, putative phage associated protein n=1 Tax=Oceanibaculum indicum P24 TaxID=1207063 RepID=K2IYH5_9PROT|nr:tape measure protein [Oceanibaculum indicum]EKE75526.1 putative tail length tape measure protein, putative phage associated protein [Oceanibaculum indicum P24]